MKLLAIDSSGQTASAAILDETKVIAEYTVDYKLTHSQTLLPMIDQIVQMTRTDLSEIDAIAIAAGPGSFTGLRIGSATAKGLGLALGCPLISVPTLEGLACCLYGTEGLVCPMMDARRNQVYTGLYRFDDRGLCVVSDQEACPVEDILEKVNENGQPVTFLGDGVPVNLETIREKVNVPFRIAPPHLSRQRAGAVGVRAMALAEEGRIQTAAEHAPIYLRKSQAERELAKKGGHLPDED